MRWASPGVRLAGGAFVAAVGIGILGGLIGLGGGEFRLPVLILWLGMAARAAVPVNLCVSLVTLAGALLARGGTVPLAVMLPHLHLVVALAAGGILGATLGARQLARLSDRRLDAAVAALLATIGCVLVLQGVLPGQAVSLVSGTLTQLAVAVVAGVAIGAVASLLGVAGGELLIPTFVLAFAVPVKIAGSLSALVSLAMILAGLLRMARDDLLPGRSTLARIVAPMAAGSLLGAAIGGALLGLVPATLLEIGLGVLLIGTAAHTWRRSRAHSAGEIAR